MNFQDLNSIDGIQFIPVNDKKQPLVKGWQTLFKKHNLTQSFGVGMACGALSGNLEALDFDLKYDLTGSLFENYKRLINEINPEIFPKLVIQKTQNNGFHLIYRCRKIEGNLKLANRATTEAEKLVTFNIEVSVGKEKESALKVAQNDKVRVLIETRGEGGQIVCFPTKGYEIVQGDYYSITEITPDERETLHGIARQFNQIIEENKPNVKLENRKGVKGISPFDDYNERGDVVGLLEEYGWKNLGTKGNKVMFLRPGQTTAQSSGNFNVDKNWFTVFTTSTEFEPQKAYLPCYVFAKLQANDDFKLAAKKLYDLGFGERKEVEREINLKTPSKISLIDDDLSFLENLSNYDEYLELSRKNLIPKGLPTNIPALDKFFLFKRSDLVMINGVDNVGKTIVVIYLQLLAAMYHGWNFIVFSTENTNRNLYKRIMEFYWGKSITNMNDVEMKVAKEFVQKHFIFIKSDEDLFNYRDVINMTKKAMGKYKIDGGLIDPYNSLKIEITNTSKLNTHEYHYEAISELKQFGNKYDISWFINNHAVTSALRTKDNNGFQKAPGKEDTEGGGKFSNKAAQFLTIHRLTQHPTEWMVTEIHVRKVKETETGGRVTQRDIPVKLVMNKNTCGFSEYIDGGGIGQDAVFNWHNREKKIEIFEPNFNGWAPFNDNNEDLF